MGTGNFKRKQSIEVHGNHNHNSNSLKKFVFEVDSVDSSSGSITHRDLRQLSQFLYSVYSSVRWR